MFKYSPTPLKCWIQQSRKRYLSGFLQVISPVYLMERCARLYEIQTWYWDSMCCQRNSHIHWKTNFLFSDGRSGRGRRKIEKLQKFDCICRIHVSIQVWLTFFFLNRILGSGAIKKMKELIKLHGPVKAFNARYDCAYRFSLIEVLILCAVQSARICGGTQTSAAVRLWVSFSRSCQPDIIRAGNPLLWSRKIFGWLWN